MLASKSVLVVDDEPRICQLLKIKLNVSGYEVITTTNGAEAIDLVRTQNPNVVLLDVVMPGISGMDVLEAVRKFSRVPIIVFTGRPEIAQIAIQFGANDYIAKPFDPDLLVKKIKLVLESATTKRQKYDNKTQSPAR